ncbi:MAG: hypothetical protein IKD78_02250 [Bacteroidales bacterium]|nr:hypothetical protein [Bacteroidales bacterium]
MRKKLRLRHVSLKKLNRKYDFLMSHDETGRPMLNFKLNLLNLVLVIIGLALLLIVIRFLSSLSHPSGNTSRATPTPISTVMSISLTSVPTRSKGRCGKRMSTSTT